MIGQAGNGSPEAGIQRGVDPRVLVYTLHRPRSEGERTQHLGPAGRLLEYPGHFVAAGGRSGEV